MVLVLLESLIVPGVVVALALAFKLCSKEDGQGMDRRNDLFVAWEVLLATIGIGGTAWVVGHFGNPKDAELAGRGSMTAIFISVFSLFCALYLRFGGYDTNTHRLKTRPFWFLNILSVALLLLAVSYVYLSISVTVKAR
jgi:hypothetical protein